MTTRRLAAILAADVAGYSRLMAADEVGTLEALKACRREIVDPAIAAHKGRIVKTTGDGMLVEFASAVDAVTCAAAVQEKMAQRTGELRIAFRIGINVGDIIIDGDDIFGDGVNVAARVENECEPGGICLSAQAFDQVRNKTKLDFHDLGERTLKNIDRPVRIFALRTAASVTAAPSIPEPGKPLPLPDKPSIAVLPFQNMSGDPEQEYFADGIVEDIITALSRFKSLFVIARNSSFTYKGKPVDIKQVGRELGVRYVLEGSVRKAGGRIRITGQLIEAATGVHLWADRFDGGIEDVFDLQDKVTAQVAGTIAPVVHGTEVDRRRSLRAVNLDAYDHLLAGLYEVAKRTHDGTSEALRRFRAAAEIDPDYAPALSNASYCYVQRNQYGWMSDWTVEVAEALRLAHRAAELARDDAEVLSLAAMSILNLGRDVERFFVLSTRATDINPNHARAWMFSGWAHLYVGEHGTGLEHFHRALRLSPADPVRDRMMHGIATGHLLRDEPLLALEWAERAYAENRQNPALVRTLAGSAAFAGRSERARQALAELQQLQPGSTISGVRHFLTQRLPWKQQTDVERLLQGLRLAGLPE